MKVSKTSSLLLLLLLALCACEKGSTLSGEELRASLEGRYFESATLCTFTKKDGTTREPYPGGSYTVGAPFAIWFKDGKIYAPASFEERDIRSRKWTAYKEEKDLGKVLLFTGRDYQYGMSGEVSSTSGHPFPYETIGGKFFLKADGGKQILATVTYPDEIADDQTIFPKAEYYLQEELAPDKDIGVAEYHLFNSDEEALEYIVDQMGDWEPAEPLPPYFPD